MRKKYVYKNTFSLVELTISIAIISILFVLFAGLLTSTDKTTKYTNILEVLSGEGMKILDDIKLNMRTCERVYTREDSYYQKVNLPLPALENSKLPSIASTMSPNNSNFDSNDVGNILFYVEELPPCEIWAYTEEKESKHNDKGHGNNADHDDEDNPGKGKGDHGADEGVDDDGYDDDEGSQGNNAQSQHQYRYCYRYRQQGDDGILRLVSRYRFTIYYLTELTDHRLPSYDGYLQLIKATSEEFVDIRDLERLKNDEQISYEDVIGLVGKSIEEGGYNIHYAWDKEENSPANAFFAFEDKNQDGIYDNVKTTPETDFYIGFNDYKKLLQVSGTLGSGIFSVAYNNMEVSSIFQVPIYAQPDGDFPGGFEILVSGEGKYRRIFISLVTVYYQDDGYLSEKSSIVAVTGAQ